MRSRPRGGSPVDASAASFRGPASPPEPVDLSGITTPCCPAHPPDEKHNHALRAPPIRLQESSRPPFMRRTAVCNFDTHRPRIGVASGLYQAKSRTPNLTGPRVRAPTKLTGRTSSLAPIATAPARRDRRAPQSVDAPGNPHYPPAARRVDHPIAPCLCSDPPKRRRPNTNYTGPVDRPHNWRDSK